MSPEGSEAMACSSPEMDFVHKTVPLGLTRSMMIAAGGKFKLLDCAMRSTPPSGIARTTDVRQVIKGYTASKLFLQEIAPLGDIFVSTVLFVEDAPSVTLFAET